MKFYRIWLSMTLAAALLPALAQAQNLFVSCQDGNIYQFDTNGVQSTFATGLSRPQGLAFDSAGNLFVAGYQQTIGGSNYVYKFTPQGLRSTIAFVSAAASHFSGIAIDTAGNFFVVTEGSDGQIYEVTTSGTQSIFATNLVQSQSLAFDRTGNLFVADSSGTNGTTYQFAPDGTQSEFASDTGPGSYLAFDNADNLFMAAGLTGNIYEFTTNGTQSTFASGYYGPMAFDRMTNLFVTSTIIPLGGTLTNRIFEIAPDGVRSTFASLPSKAAFVAVQPTLASGPALYIASNGHDINWAYDTNYHLQFTTNLAAPDWQAVEATNAYEYTIFAGGTNYHHIDLDASQFGNSVYFRLSNIAP